ncbi:hypothetical protein KSP39_PZI002147 [Platanthera zijinensis]|uniref:Uncharacterized protein n=1 Tax=Platanthera zijinensis TaxID=2320716 RepID=A0AAP0BX11_9ASPA
MRSVAWVFVESGTPIRCWGLEEMGCQHDQQGKVIVPEEPVRLPHTTTSTTELPQVG